MTNRIITAALIAVAIAGTTSAAAEPAESMDAVQLESFFLNLKGSPKSDVSDRAREHRRRFEIDAVNRWLRVKDASVKQGYFVATDEELGRGLGILQSVDSLIQPTEISGQMGFVAADLDTPEYRDGDLIGIDADAWGDGKIHELFYVYEFPELGTVVIREYSFATAPTSTFRISKTLENISVNGYPGTYLVYKNGLGENVQTRIRFYTESKAYTVIALSEVRQEDTDRFKKLMALTAALY